MLAGADEAAKAETATAGLGAGAGAAPAASDDALRHRGAVGGAVRSAGRDADRRRLARARAELVDAEAEAELGWLVRTIGGIRAARTELNVPPGQGSR